MYITIEAQIVIWSLTLIISWAKTLEELRNISVQCFFLLLLILDSLTLSRSLSPEWQCTMMTFLSEVGVWWCLTNLSWDMMHTYKFPSNSDPTPWHCSLRIIITGLSYWVIEPHIWGKKYIQPWPQIWSGK